MSTVWGDLGGLHGFRPLGATPGSFSLLGVIAFELQALALDFQEEFAIQTASAASAASAASEKVKLSSEAKGRR